MMDMAHMLVVIAKTTTETWYQLVFDTSGGGVALYRSKIHAILAEISNIVLIHATRCMNTIFVPNTGGSRELQGDLSGVSG